MRIFVVFCLLAAAAAGSFDSVDLRSVRPRLRQVRVPLAATEGSGIKSRITNGQQAAAKQFPFQAGLLLQNLDETYSWGGGTLISDRWVLTAGSCGVNVLKIRVILGTLRSNPLGDIGEVVMDVEVNNKTVIVHPEYDDWTLTNDLALIRLPEPVTFSEYIKPAKLPSFTGRAPTYSWNTAIASGWGKITDESEEIVSLLRWTEVPVISNAKCATVFGRMETTHLCAQGDGKSTCDGDSGGPLVLEGTDTIIGVSSFVVYLACEWGFPAGFSRVTSFLPWIEKISGVTP